MIREKPAFIAPGLLTFLFLIVLELLTIAALVALIIGRAPALLIVLDVIAIAAVGICFAGFLVVSPNEAQVLQLFGNYVGTVNKPGSGGRTRSRCPVTRSRSVSGTSRARSSR